MGGWEDHEDVLKKIGQHGNPDEVLEQCLAMMGNKLG